MKIALFRDVQLGFETVAKIDLEKSDAYVRVSKVIDVDFPPLEEDAAEKQLTALGRMRAEAERNNAKELKRLDERIAEIRKAMGVAA